MKKSLGVFLTLIAVFSTASLFAQNTVEKVKANLIGERHLSGPAVTPDEVGGRLVLVWDGRGVVNQMLNNIRDYEENTSDNNNWKPKLTEYGSYRECERQIDEFRRAVKGAYTDGRILVVVAVAVPDNPREFKRYRRAIRRLPFAFPIYNFESGTVAYDPRGNQAVQGGSISDIARKANFLDLIEQTPPYVKGRIFHYLTPQHEVLGKNMVEGRNIEKSYAQLKKEAESGEDNDRTKEAAMMVATVDALISKRSSEIENALQSAPSLALEKINMLGRTMPSAAKKYARAYKALQRSAEVKKLDNIRSFIRDISIGKYGPADVVKYSKMRIRSLTPLLKSKNASIVAEANELKRILDGYAEEE